MALKPRERQMSMLVPNVEELIPAGHRYRKLLGVRNKVYFQALMEALVFNFKRLIAINSPPIRLA